MALPDNLFLEIKPKKMYVVNLIIDSEEYNRRIDDHKKEIKYMPYYEQDLYRTHLEKIETSREIINPNMLIKVVKIILGNNIAKNITTKV